MCRIAFAIVTARAAGERNADLFEADPLRRNGHALVSFVLNHLHRGGEAAAVDGKRYLLIRRLTGDGSAGVVGSLLPGPSQIGSLGDQLGPQFNLLGRAGAAEDDAEPVGLMRGRVVGLAQERL